MPNLRFLLSKFRAFFLILTTSIVVLALNSCSSDDRFEKSPEGNLEMDLRLGFSNASKDSIYLSFELHIDGLFNSTANYSKEIYEDKVVFNLGDFTASHPDGAQPNETFSAGTKIPNKANTAYKIIFNRPHRIDTAIIYNQDSFYATRSLSKQIYFKHDTIRKVFPNWFWAKVYNCNCSDTLRIIEVDQEMKKAGCKPITLTTGNYEHFRVNKQREALQAYGSTCHCEEVRLYQFEGDREKLKDFYKRLRAYYNYKIYMDIQAWDGWSVR